MPHLCRYDCVIANVCCFVEFVYLDDLHFSQVSRPCDYEFHFDDFAVSFFDFHCLFHFNDGSWSMESDIGEPFKSYFELSEIIVREKDIYKKLEACEKSFDILS